MARFHFPPRTQRGAILGFSAGQMLAVVGALACLVAAVRAGLLLWDQHHPGQAAGAAVGLAVVAAVALLIGLGRWRGRRVTEWLPVLLGYTIERFGRQDRYRGGIFGATAGAEYPDLPGELAAYRWLTCLGPDGRSPVGLLVDTVADTVTAVLATSGHDKAATLLLVDETEQDRRLAAWAACMRTLAVEVPPLVRWQWLTRTVPDSGSAAAHYLAAEAVRTDTPGFAANAELIGQLAPRARRHEVMLAVVLSLPEMRREIRAAGGGPAGQAAATWAHLHHIDAAIRQAGITTGSPPAASRSDRCDGTTTLGWYTPRGLAAVLRTQFHPDDQALVDARTDTGPLTGSSGPGAGVSPRLAGPIGDESWATCYRHDAFLSRTMWMYEPPHSSVPPTWLVPLLAQAPGRHTVSLVAEPVRGERARWQARRDIIAHTSEHLTRSKLGLLTGARDRVEADAARRIDEEMAAGHIRYRYALLITVTAGTLDELRRDFDRVRLTLSACETVPLDLEQAQGFWACALPLGRGLAPVRGLG